MNVRVERAGNRILLSSQAPTPGLKTSIPGAYWRATEGVWSMPLELTTCHLLRERFGSRLQIGPALTAWARGEKATRERAASLALAADASLDRLPDVAPHLHAAMDTRKYQRAGVRFIMEATGRDDRRRALLADTVGLGKTIQGIAAVLESGEPGPYLIAAPKGAAELVWGKEIRKWVGDGARVVTLPESKVKRNSILSALATDYNRNPASLARTWVITHPAIVRTQTWWICLECAPALGAARKPDRNDLMRWVKTPSATKYKAGMVQELDCGHEKTSRTPVVHDHTFPQLFTMEYGAVIADESDQILIRLTGTPNLQRRGMEMLRDLVRPGGLRLAMSGTPFRSKPHQIWSTLNWLDPVRWSAKWRFIGQYWTLGGYSGYTVGDFLDDREQFLVDELKDVMIRRTRDMVRDDLPPKLYPSNVDQYGESGLTQGIYLPMTAKQLQAYQQMEKEGSAAIDGGDVTAIGILAELTRLKQFAGAEGQVLPGGEFRPKAAGNKYEWIVEFLRELGFPDKPATKLVIASQFTQLLNAFKEGVEREFKGKVGQAMITGEVSSTAKRSAIVDRFEGPDSGLDLLWINTKAGGSAITLDQAEIMVVLDETWVSDEQEQLEGRIDNRQPERRIVPRSYYYLRSTGSIEESIAAANAAAKERGERILNGAAIAARAKELTHRRTEFTGGPEGKIRQCRGCGVARNQWHLGDCRWDGDF